MKLQAPVIRHRNHRPEYSDIELVVSDACHAIHATGRSERLLLAYGMCSNGFAPSQRYLENVTGIPSNKIYQIRKELVDLGVISYGKETHEIFVDWDRIRLYATLDPELTSQNRKHAYFAPAGSRVEAREKMGEKKMKDHNGRKLTPAQRHFYKTVENMTPDEWNSLMRGIGYDIPEPMDLYEDGLSDEDWSVTWEDLGIDETCPKACGPIIYCDPLPF